MDTPLKEQADRINVIAVSRLNSVIDFFISTSPKCILDSYTHALTISCKSPLLPFRSRGLVYFDRTI
jgi:hypothetical protein